MGKFNAWLISFIIWQWIANLSKYTTRSIVKAKIFVIKLCVVSQFYTIQMQ